MPRRGCSAFAVSSFRRDPGPSPARSLESSKSQWALPACSQTPGAAHQGASPDKGASHLAEGHCGSFSHTSGIPCNPAVGGSSPHFLSHRDSLLPKVPLEAQADGCLSVEVPNHRVSFCTCWLLPLPHLLGGNWQPSSKSLTPHVWPFPSIFPSADQENTTALIPAAHNTGGSLPDLTNIHFPSPLPTPLDPEEPTFPALSSSSSTGNLAANLTHLGIGTGQGKAGWAGSFPVRASCLVKTACVCEQ